MSQTTIKNFFNIRKRPATDEIVSTKNKIPHLEQQAFDASTDCVGKNDASAAKNDVVNNNLTPNISSNNELNEDIKVITSGQTSDLKNQLEKFKANNTFAKKINANNVGIEQPSKLNSLSSARKELSLGDLRKRLAASPRLAELKATADRLSKEIQQLTESTDKRNLKEFKTIDVDVPASPSNKELIRNELLSPKKVTDSSSILQKPFISPRKVVISPVKSPNKVPAYINHHAALAKSTTILQLPHKYRVLAEHFRGLETVVALLHNRNEKITFAKLKPSVQDMLKRNFTEKHLAQIKHLVPDFYNFEIQKIKNFSTSSQKEAYELVVSPNFPFYIKIMNASVLLERRRYFNNTLLQLVKKLHRQFLMSLDPPMNIPEDKLVRWHPEFKLEDVPEIECAKLPVMPNVEKFSTAQDVLSKARELFKFNPKMEKALQKLSDAKAHGLKEEEKIVNGIHDKNHNYPSTSTEKTPQQQIEITLLNPALRNLPKALLEKVKAKQAAKALETMIKSSEHEEMFIIYSGLPDLSRVLRNIFVAERKNVLPLNIVLSKLDSSFKAKVSASDLQRDIKILTDEVPQWIKLHEIRNTMYLKLDKNCDMKHIVNKLETAAAKYKSD